MKNTYHYIIADHGVELVFDSQKHSNTFLLTSLDPFKVSASEVTAENLLFTLVVCDDVSIIKKTKDTLIGEFDTGNGNTMVTELPNGGYQYVIKNINNDIACVLHTDKRGEQARCTLQQDYANAHFGINNALMIVFAYASAFKQTLLLHASLVRHNDKGYAFVAKSGTGKSTHVNMWLQNIADCDLMNDDNPIVRIIDNEIYIYGTPWSGKTPCYRNIKARLGAICKVVRDKKNDVLPYSPISAFTAMLPCCSAMKWDSGCFRSFCDTLSFIIERGLIHELHCLPNSEAAIVCHKKLVKEIQ